MPLAGRCASVIHSSARSPHRGTMPVCLRMTSFSGYLSAIETVKEIVVSTAVPEAAPNM